MFQITLDNVKVHLNEDRPPVNITSPGPIPIDLHIKHLYIVRTEDGIFNLFPNSNDKSSIANGELRFIKFLLLVISFVFIPVGQQSNKDSSQVDSKTLNNEDLRRLMTFERISEENRLLRKSKEENDKENDLLKDVLKKSQDEVIRLLSEKQNLLEEIRRLQHQCNGSKRQQCCFVCTKCFCNDKRTQQLYRLFIVLYFIRCQIYIIYILNFIQIIKLRVIFIEIKYC